MLTAARSPGARLLLASSTRCLTSPKARAANIKPTRGSTRYISTTRTLYRPTTSVVKKQEDEDADVVPADEYDSLGPRDQTEHAVISAFDLFSIGGAFVTFIIVYCRQYNILRCLQLDLVRRIP